MKWKLRIRYVKVKNISIGMGEKAFTIFDTFLFCKSYIPQT